MVGGGEGPGLACYELATGPGPGYPPSTGKSCWAVVPAEYGMKKGVWASEGILDHEPKCLSGVEVWTVPMPSNRDLWAT